MGHIAAAERGEERKKKKAGGGGRRLEFTGKGNLTGHRYQPWQGRQAQGWEKKSGKVKKGIAWEGKKQENIKKDASKLP